MVYVGPLAGVPSVLAELGGDAEEIFADADVDLMLCEHQHNQISALGGGYGPGLPVPHALTSFRRIGLT